jgi:hypothetical protein
MSFSPEGTNLYSLDPGSKFGLEKEPNEHPGPGAYNNFFTISNSNPKNLQPNQTNRNSPPPQTGLYNIQRSQRNSAFSISKEQGHEWG